MHKGLTIVMMVFMADIVFNLTPIPNTAPEPVVVETQAPTQAWIPTQEGFVAYRIHGKVPPIEWQQYLYNELASRGFAWYMPYAVCQIQQESCWNQWSDNGTDRGLTQQKGIYWDSRAAHWGIPGASIWDPYAQLHVFACQMTQYLGATGGDVNRALSMYFLGYDGYDAFYIQCVMSHWGALEEVR